MESIKVVNCPACGNQVSIAALACPHCGHPLKTRRRIWPWIAFVLVLAAIVAYGISTGFLKSFLWGIQQGAAGRSALDVNGLPKCDDPEVVDLAKQAVANAPGIAKIDIFTFDQISYVKPPSSGDLKTDCQAHVLTNGGKGVLNYSLSKIPDGRIYVEARILPE